jgi:uncharacterized protein (TIRG00374 family)
MKRISFWLGIVISVITIFLLVQGTDWQAFARALSKSNLFYLIPAVVFLVLSIYLRAFRWRLLFYPVKGLSIKKFFSALNISYLFLNILPARLGEFVRILVIANSQNVSKAQALSTIIVERILDVFSILILLLVMLPFIRLPDWLGKSSLTVTIAFIALALIAISLSTQKSVDFFLKFPIFKKFEKVIINLATGLATLRNPRIFLCGLSLTLISWILLGLLNWFSLLATNVTSNLPIAVFSLVATTLAALIPSTPGYIGVYQYVAILSLVPFGIAKEPALTFAIVVSAVNYLCTTALGIGSLFYEKLSFFELKSASTSDLLQMKRPASL